MSSKRILGIIPARGGSRGIPRKNLIKLAGRPLLSYTIEAAKKSRLLTRTVLSSEDPEIIQEAKKLGADIAFTRPAQLSTDSAGSASVVKHALEEIESQEANKYDYVCLLEPTCPLRISDDIDSALKLLIESGADSVVSVKKIEAPHPVKTLLIKGGYLTPFLPDRWKSSLTRQELEPVFAVNGAVYAVKREVLLKTVSLWGERALPFIMPDERSINIDTPFDAALAEFLLTLR